MTPLPDEVNHKIANQLSFALYRAANRIIRLHKPFLKPLGLTFPQYLVVVELLNSPVHSVGELGAKVDMDTGTITPLLKRLEQSGLISRRRDMQDERRVLVELTVAGLALRDKVWAVSDQVNATCHIDNQQADELRMALDDMERPLEAKPGRMPAMRPRRRSAEDATVGDSVAPR